MGRYLLILILALGILPTQETVAAYCALRDPVETIYQLFPEADSYRSNVKTVGREARATVLSELPIAMHFNELGRHTLYIALKKGRAIGYVHARSELSEWGLTEYAWAISPEMKIRSVKVQRSRDPSVRRRVTKELSSLVSGHNLTTLRELFLANQEKNDNLMVSLLASGMKTLVITQTVWQEELAANETLELVQRIYPSAKSYQAISHLYDTKALTMLTDLDLEKSPIFDRTSLSAHRVKGNGGRVLGLAVRSAFDLSDPQRTLLWVASPNGEIEQVYNTRTNKSDADFLAVIGFGPKHPRDCSTLADMGALEIATLARRHLGD